MWILNVLGPSTIKFSPLRVGQLQFTGTLDLREALPKSHGQFSPIACGKPEKLRKGTRWHGAIVSRVAVEPQSC